VKPYQIELEQVGMAQILGIEDFANNIEKYSFSVQAKTHNAVYLQFPICEFAKIL
jgi:hypothetical protein